MSEETSHSRGARRAAARVARNASVRAAADLIGKFASLALIAVLARHEGPEGVGVLVFALAWCELATTPIDMGIDRYLLRRVAVDRTELDRRFFNAMRLKLGRAVPLILLSWALILLLDYDRTTEEAVFLLTGAYLLDSLSLSLFAAFNGLERADLVAGSMLVRRIVSAGLGVALLWSGYGVIAVAGAYALGSVLSLAVGMLLLARGIGMPARELPREPRRDLSRTSLPFAAQELMAAGIARLDIVLLSLLATQAVVGYYGSAYRLLEATLFLSVALQGAFAAMFTYLNETSEPTINSVFQRSVKLSLTLLVPCAVVMAVLADPLIELLFGPGFDDAVEPLRLLAATVVPLGLVLLATTLISGRRDPKILMRHFAVALVLNVGLNLALIPSLDADGAALAMLATYAIFGVLMMRLSIQTVGPLHAGQTLGAALVAGAALAGVGWLLQDWLGIALAAGVLTYVGVFAAVERRLAPADFDFMVGMLRERLPSRRNATLPKQPSESA